MEKCQREKPFTKEKQYGERFALCGLCGNKSQLKEQMPLREKHCKHCCWVKTFDLSKTNFVQKGTPHFLWHANYSVLFKDIYRDLILFKYRFGEAITHIGAQFRGVSTPGE